MILVGGRSAICLDAYRKASKRGAVGCYKQGHFLIWADDVQDEWGSPDADRETSGK